MCKFLKTNSANAFKTFGEAVFWKLIFLLIRKAEQKHFEPMLHFEYVKYLLFWPFISLWISMYPILSEHSKEVSKSSYY